MGQLVLEMLLYVSLVMGLVFEVFIPAWNGTPLFPIIWSRKTKLQVASVSVDLQAEEDALEAEVAAKVLAHKERKKS